jgi:hypothetical protein
LQRSFEPEALTEPSAVVLLTGDGYPEDVMRAHVAVLAARKAKGLGIESELPHVH